MTARQRAAMWGQRLAALTWKEILQLSRDVPLLLFLVYSFSLSVLVSGAGITMQLTNAAPTPCAALRGSRCESSLRRYRTSSHPRNSTSVMRYCFFSAS